MISNNIIKEITEPVKLPTGLGTFGLTAFVDYNNKEHLALTLGDFYPESEVMVRVHSSCVTGDIFGSNRCDCGDQLHEAMRMIQANKQGILLYMDQEGRNIGLINKLKAYKLQDQGMDTIAANLNLGFSADDRDYEVSAEILKLLNVTKVQLITNNPQKQLGLQENGITVTKLISLIIQPNMYNKSYLEVKKNQMGHKL